MIANLNAPLINDQANLIFYKLVSLELNQRLIPIVDWQAVTILQISREKDFVLYYWAKMLTNCC